MNAKEARAAATKYQSMQVDPVVTILQEIDKAVKDGLFEVHVYDDLRPVDRMKLTSMGYQVGETKSFRNEYLTKITW
ncbi:hypothetical protein HDC90_001125 [Pedobacter sp. AK013]|uniref:hypothetical protein n=1 Tax=Pedobacter sp. AK013 TaxID=2723071 RepID=UPI00160CAAAD|nr:hypothetical protein [Pedobacter sp. AK013]MBB6236513.1 hypothetical protein [Pedobacter sp. AK013]